MRPDKVSDGDGERWRLVYRDVEQGCPGERAVQRRDVGARFSHESRLAVREASEQTPEEGEPLELVLDVTLANHQRKSKLLCGAFRRQADVIRTRL